MDVSFELFKQKLLSALPIGWEVLKGEKECFTLKLSTITLEYRNIQEIANKLIEDYMFPCAVYRVQRFEDGELLQETYKIVCEYKETLFKFEARVKWLNKACPMKVKSYKMDDEWNQKEINAIPTEVCKFQQSFLEAIHELPEFRLYAITGLLSTDEQ